jgi:kynurenine 3-monooxygenase
MPNSATPREICVIGGGLGGTLMSIYLARRGFDVTILERRPDIRNGVVDHGRSINMTIAERGLAALEWAGLREKVMAITMPLKGRLVHGDHGYAHYQPYGRTPEQVHYSIKRSGLNMLLLDEAEALPNIRLRFQKRYVRGGRDGGLFLVQDERTGETEYQRADVLVGADGSHSALRREMQRGLPAEHRVEYVPEGYKELTIPAGPGPSFVLDPKVLHVWPRGGAVLIGIPNLDCSFTCTFTMPLEAEVSFRSLASRAQVDAFFQRHFPEVLALAPDMVDEFVSRPPSRYLTMTTAPWCHGGRIVLLGDACHCVLPFYGQGMNAAFEDARMLDECLATYQGQWERAFSSYQARRKPHTDVLARLSKDNYIELKERVRSPLFVARRRLDLLLDRLWPGVFATLYSLVTHTTTPYADAVARCERRQRWMRRSGLEALLTVLAAGLAVLASARDGWRARRATRQAGAAPAGTGRRQAWLDAVPGRREASSPPPARVAGGN